MKKISRRSFLAVCGAMAATAALTACGGSSASTAGTAASGSTAGSAASGEVFELKLSTTQTDTSMIYQGLQAAADKVAEDTDGHVKVTIYPSSQLGGEEDMIDQDQSDQLFQLTDFFIKFLHRKSSLFTIPPAQRAAMQEDIYVTVDSAF